MYKIKRMTEEHIDDVAEIEKECFTIAWTKEDFDREMKNNMAYYFVAESEGKIVGYAGLWHVVNEGQITNVAVLEEYRKQGIGAAFMEAFIDLAKRLEMIGLTLEVKISNLEAQRLYTRYGFRPEGFRKHYYQDTGEDAVIMWKYFENYENFQEVKE
ncbi:MAG: ribosomal protein S18-alanine N-acetyltransferase [Clostridiales bacterium]|nr:ribosomal protein S18-alanine N-acetyltransferase [Clostridiales bacterium]